MIFGFIHVWLCAQNYNISGKVTDEKNMPLIGCHVKLGEIHTITDINGNFSFGQFTHPKEKLSISFIGYQTLDTLLANNNHQPINIQMHPNSRHLKEVAVKGVNGKNHDGLSRDVVQADELRQTMNGTLSKTLERLPGFNSMDIGVSASKPVIRGMGFNRVVVIDNGIKQEGQQWGADHGLEIDPFLTERAEVIKGAVSLEHGSEAIGGILQLSSNKLPEIGLRGNLQLLGKTINETAGGSLFMEGSNGTIYVKGRATILDYGDYRIPTDTIVYLSRKIPIYKGRLKNSAGKEQDLYFQTGIVRPTWQSGISGSRVWQKSGFFPGAHGIPDLERVQHDGNFRNIGYPFQNMEHLKLVSNSRIQIGQSYVFFDLGYQNNHRQEWSLFHTHFGDLEPPATNPDLELDFKLATLSGNGRWTMPLGANHSVSSGVQYQHQENTSGGYGFFLPTFSRQTAGLFVKSQWQINPKTSLSSGIRYDKGKLNTIGFFDEILYNYLIDKGNSEAETIGYAQRANSLNRQFGNASWLGSLKYEPQNAFTLTFNAGSSFRIPTAIELAANGIHHGSFRHEMGSANLSSEKGYFIDGSAEYQKGQFSVAVSPYLYYFTNYIFLAPTGEWSKLPHAGQIYRYMQSEAVMGGFEVSATQEFGKHLELLVNGEWLMNKQVGSNGGYPLPFSPPANIFAELSYKLKPEGKLGGTKVSVHCKKAFEQNRIARNEAVTPGYQIIGLGLHTTIKTGGKKILVNVQAHNILNTKYFNHISFYRKLEIPEPGRNIQVLLSMPLSR